MTNDTVGAIWALILKIATVLFVAFALIFIFSPIVVGNHARDFAFINVDSLPAADDFLSLPPETYKMVGDSLFQETFSRYLLDSNQYPKRPAIRNWRLVGLVAHSDTFVIRYEIIKNGKLIRWE